MKIPLATYNRVIWGIWEEAKAPQPRRSSQRALALLEKLEMLSTPLLLSRKEVLKMQNPRTWELYQFELKPSTKTYEMVLDVCADTAAPEEYEMAARVASTVGNRLLGLDDFKEKSIDKIQTCLDRLESGSEFVGPMTELVVQLKAKRTAEAS